MYDDFWAGYTGQIKPGRGIQEGSQPIKFYSSGGRAIVQRQAQQQQQMQRPGVYDKSKFIRMRGPNGETGDIFANGKMYIILGPGKGQVRTFGSRPFAIKYMQSKGWVLA
jgi:hypothetical protein